MTEIVVPGGHLYVGGMELCTVERPTIHACKFPCYWEVVGKKQLHLGDEEYLYAMRRSFFTVPEPRVEPWESMYLNMVDPKKPLFYIESFREALSYIDEALGTYKAVSIHCNRGLSRSAAIAYVWLARNGVIPKVWYNAVTEFEKLYPAFNPGDGILSFMWENWKELTNGS